MSLGYEASVIFVKDIVVSRAFYEGLLGQTVMADHGENVVYVKGLSLWQAEHASSIIFGRRRSRKKWGSDNLELYFESDDISSEFERLQAAGVQLIHEVHEEPWGQQTFRCTSMPMELVLQTIGYPRSC